ncbi:MAG: MFS transporter [Alphaproteobacteria bacterium]|nr:MFS transporter [Alphaproteobacteria bacterium]
MAQTGDETSSRYPGWRVVGACLAMAMFGWGLAFYGSGVYLAAFQKAYGWPASLIAGATTACYLLSALLLTRVAWLIDRFGPRRFVLSAIGALAVALVIMAFADRPWMVYAAFLAMSFGWIGLGSGSISMIIGRWFERRRGLAFSLALNGASLGGVVVTPSLLLAIEHFGLRAGVLAGAAVMIVILVPVVVLFVRAPERARAPGTRPVAASNLRILSMPQFWAVAGPFSIGFLALVGYIVHQVAILLPKLGVELAGAAVGIMTGAALVGRFVLGLVVDRLDQRRVAGIAFLVLAVVLFALHELDDPLAILAVCAVLGAALGNATTLPSLVVQRVFEPALFAPVVGMVTATSQFTYALGPILVGAVHDLTGGYDVPLLLCAALDAVAGAMFLAAARRPAAP